jgi:hypothetical protein
VNSVNEQVAMMAAQAKRIAALERAMSHLVGTAGIADGAITTAKILDGTIATGDVADGAITTAKILDGTIATGDIADNAITFAKLDKTAWTAVTYQNSWVDYSTASYGPTQVRRVGDWVEGRGLIKGGADATVAFTLDVGLRPNFPRYGSANDTGSTPVYGTCVIGTNGTVLIINKGTIANGIDVRFMFSLTG